MRTCSTRMASSRASLAGYIASPFSARTRWRGSTAACVGSGRARVLEAWWHWREDSAARRVLPPVGMGAGQRVRRSGPGCPPPLVTSRARALRRVELAVATLCAVLLANPRSESRALAGAGMTTSFPDLTMTGTEQAGWAGLRSCVDFLGGVSCGDLDLARLGLLRHGDT